MSLFIDSLLLLLSVSVLISFWQKSEDENGLLNIQLEDLVGMIQNTQKSRRFLPLIILIVFYGLQICRHVDRMNSNFKLYLVRYIASESGSSSSIGTC